MSTNEHKIVNKPTTTIFLLIITSLMVASVYMVGATDIEVSPIGLERYTETYTEIEMIHDYRFDTIYNLVEKTYAEEHNTWNDPYIVTQAIVELSDEFGFDPLLIASVAHFESKFDTRNIGGANERGIMQVHPCHRQYNRSRLSEVQYGIRAGLEVLRSHVNDRHSLSGGLRAYYGVHGSGRTRYDSLYNRLKGANNERK